jgi:CheY-like chemotaxis protein
VSGDILVIEDDPVVANSVSRLLAAAGYTVMTAGNGRDGLNIVRRSRPRLVIVDILMPETQGLETIRMLRRMSRELPIIALSNAGRTGSADFTLMAELLGATAILRNFAAGELLPLAAQCLAQPCRPAIAADASEETPRPHAVQVHFIGAADRPEKRHRIADRLTELFAAVRDAGAVNDPLPTLQRLRFGRPAAGRDGDPGVSRSRKRALPRYR